MRTDLLISILLFLALSLQRSGAEDESELAQQIKNGDKAAFDAFYQRHSAALISFLCSKGLSQQEAEDLLQQAFLIIWEKRREIDPDKSLRSFLFTTAYRRMINLFRDRKNSVPDYAYALEADGQNPEESTETRQAMNQLHAALEEMPERRRRVFELCYMQEFTYKEAAEALDVSPKTIENHMALALRDLRKALKNFSPDG